MKQTVTSKYEPKSKNVTWIDMSTGHPVQKNFINGMWRPTGGNNSESGNNGGEISIDSIPILTYRERTSKELEKDFMPHSPYDYSEYCLVLEKANVVPLIFGIKSPNEYNGESIEIYTLQGVENGKYYGYDDLLSSYYFDSNYFNKSLDYNNFILSKDGTILVPGYQG